MPGEARRRAFRLWPAPARRALLMWCLWHAGGAAASDMIHAAHFDAPTDRYAHAVLGDDIEYGAIVLTLAGGAERRFVLPERLVFEDLAPRLVDLDGDGRPEVIVVESDRDLGARLAVYGSDGRITATPHIGARFRWLAPLGAADLDGDGAVEIAYVDRPHLARTLRVRRYAQGALEPVASFEGVTNHRIGETDIAGGIRDCGGGPEMILADADWRALLALRLDGARIVSRRIGGDTSRAAFARAMGCGTP